MPMKQCNAGLHFYNIDTYDECPSCHPVKTTTKCKICGNSYNRNEIDSCPNCSKAGLLKQCEYCSTHYDGNLFIKCPCSNGLPKANAKPNLDRVLKGGTQLKHYTIINDLGSGKYWNTYLASDLVNNKKVVIKEYFPENGMYRAEGSDDLFPLRSSHLDDFKKDLMIFKTNSLCFAFKHPNLSKIEMYFEMHNTGYLVMDYVEGETLSDYQRKLGRALTETELQTDLLPVLKSLAELHSRGIVHKDIKPENIFRVDCCEPVLKSFGGLNYHWGAYGTKLIGEFVMNPFQIDDGPDFSYDGSAYPDRNPIRMDLYSFGMVLYNLIAPSEDLPQSYDRKGLVFEGESDPLKPIREVAPGYSEALYKAVEACVQLKAQDRPQSVEALQAILDGKVPKEVVAESVTKPVSANTAEVIPLKPESNNSGE